MFKNKLNLMKQIELRIESKWTWKNLKFSYFEEYTILLLFEIKLATFDIYFVILVIGPLVGEFLR
jgi:hypothetical protein